MQFPIFVELHRSRLLFLFVLSAYLLAGLGVALIPWPAPVRLLLAILLLSGLGLAWRTQGQLPRGLVLHGDGRLDLRREEGARPVELLAGGVALPLLSVLRYREDGHNRALVLLPDSADPEALRRLRVWLRWCGGRRGA